MKTWWWNKLRNVVQNKCIKPLLVAINHRLQNCFVVTSRAVTRTFIWGGGGAGCIFIRVARSPEQITQIYAHYFCLYLPIVFFVSFQIKFKLIKKSIGQKCRTWIYEYTPPPPKLTFRGMSSKVIFWISLKLATPWAQIGNEQ